MALEGIMVAEGMKHEGGRGRVPVQVGGWVEMDFSCHWK